MLEFKPLPFEDHFNRLKNPAFQGRRDWMKKWNPKTCRFEDVNTTQLSFLMRLRVITGTAIKHHEKEN